MKVVRLGITAALFAPFAVFGWSQLPPIAAPYMVRDLAAGGGANADSGPRAFVPLGERVLFLATIGDGSSLLHAMQFPSLEVELLSAATLGSTWYEALPVSDGKTVYWYDGDADRLAFYGSDGTPTGTRILHRFPEFYSVRPVRGWVGALDGFALFAGHDSGVGRELWRSDGTAAGTYLIADLLEGSFSSSPRGFVRREDELCFFAYYDGGNGLFCSNGTGSGTRLVQRLGSVYEGDEGGDPIVEVAGRLVLTAEQDGHEQIVGSDGTPAGTVYLTSLPPGGSVRIHPFRSGSRAYFVADDVVHGQELWQTDGTVAGTRRISEIGYASPFQSLGERRVATEAGDWTYFVATDGFSGMRVWRTNGDPTSTQTVGGPEVQPDVTADPLLARIGGRVVFPGTGSTGHEMYSIITSSGGMELLADACSGACDGDPTPPYESGGAWFFEASIGIDREVWITDGTPAGSRQATWTSDGLSRLQWQFNPLVYLDGLLVYAASDSIHGTEPFVSDLSGSASSLATDLARGAVSSFPFAVTPLGASTVILFCSGDSSRLTLGATAGAPGDVAVLADLESPCPFSGGSTSITRVGHHAFILDRSTFSTRVWRTDGSAAGTELVIADDSEHRIFGGCAGPDHFWLVRGTGDATEIWKIAEASGPAVLHAALPDTLSDAWEPFFAGEYLYFVSTLVEVAESRVVRADTQASSFAVLPPRVYYYPTARAAGAFFVWDGNYLYFRTGSDGSSQLWRDDPQTGTPLRLTPDPSVYRVRDLAAGEGFVYFFDLSDRQTLWRSDGTVAGTVQVADIGPAPYNEEYVERPTAVVGQWLVFAAWSDDTGRELWVSNGTSAGTFPLPEIFPGLDSSDPADFAVGEQAVYLAATDPTHGRELWRVEFVAGSLSRLSDIGPGSLPASLAEIVATDAAVYFSADEGIHGSELWALSYAASCLPSSRSLCLDDGRFQVEASWVDFFGGSGDGTAAELTGDTGYFWFFDAANVETVIKVLDGLGVNQRWWVFYGALSNVEYLLDVTDTVTRVKKRYRNPPGRYASVGDTNAFSPDGALTAGPTNTVEEPGADGRPRLLDTLVGEVAASGTCTPSATCLCLQQGRFAVEASWRDFQGNTGIGTAVHLSADTGYFWFFWDTNVEVILKVLDGRPVNDRFWVYYGALSNVEYTLTVTDTATGAVRTYFNPAGRFASVGDNDAF